jgi:hypothetical protein
LIYLSHKDPGLFLPERAKYQFAPGLGYQPQVRDAGGSVIVKDLDSAIKAIDVIVIQGEGSPGPYDDAAKLEKDHYDVFMDPKEGNTTWDTYPVVENPVISNYWSLDKRIYHVSCFQYHFSDNLLTKKINCATSRFHLHLMRIIASS